MGTAKKSVFRGWLALTLIMVMLSGALSGCTSAKADSADGPATNGAEATTDGQAAGSEKLYKLAYVYDVMDLSTEKNLGYLKDYFRYYESTNPGVKIELIELNCDNDVEQQINDIQTCIAMNIDCVIFKYCDAEGLVDVINEAEAKGVKIVDWLGLPETANPTLRYIGTDESNKGRAAKEWLSQYMEEHPDEVLKVGNLCGAQAQTAQYPRYDIPEELATERPEQFIQLVKQYCAWTADDAMRVIEDWLQVYPDMNCILSASEEMTLGVIAALESAGKNPADYVIITYNGMDPGIEMLRKGQIRMDVANSPSVNQMLLGQAAISVCEGKLKGYTNVGNETIYTIVPETVEEYNKIIENVNYADEYWRRYDQYEFVVSETAP